MSETGPPEPWLRGSLPEVRSVPRAVLHALELASEDLRRWCGNLTEEELNRRPDGIPSVAFHLKHIARGVDRLLTYAEGGQLDAAQIAALKCEESEGSSGHEIFAELNATLGRAAARIRKFDADHMDDSRCVGLKKLPTTVGGLLVHIADHTQRHVGQAVTTAKVVRARRGTESPQR